jgi:hypothetical protein|tara:strand:+ start:1579 stop:1884 length:306 start_codon:yes stop_codon:yes gene_type:complete
MTLENDWKNGAMSSGTDLPADGTQNIPMSEKKSLPYPEASTGIKYVNTTGASNSTAQSNSTALSIASVSKTLEGLFGLDPVPAVDAAKLISNALNAANEKS